MEDIQNSIDWNVLDIGNQARIGLQLPEAEEEAGVASAHQGNMVELLPRDGNIGPHQQVLLPYIPP